MLINAISTDISKHNDKQTSKKIQQQACYLLLPFFCSSNSAFASVTWHMFFSLMASRNVINL